MTESPSDSSSPQYHSNKEAILASNREEKEKRVLDIDLNHPPPQTVEGFKTEIKDVKPKEAVIAIDLDGIKSYGDDRAQDVDGRAQDNEGSVKITRDLDEASGSLSKRRRYTAEEKGKKKVYEVVGDDDASVGILAITTPL